ncbi:MAG: hypothetical protein Q9170_006840 [Blastenia crenularia]
MLNMATTFVLPKVPAVHQDFLSYINGKDGNEVRKLTAPYNNYEAKLREGFAQHRDHPILRDPNVNAVPVFKQGVDIPRISKRDIDAKSHHQNYIIPLSAKDRKPAGAPAVVESIQDFKKNFSLFSESSLADLDWSNVVAAGSSVVTPLLPVPEKFNTSKKAQREYYHEKLAPSSDVDLFIWGLNEAAALKKIEQIEASVRNAILEEVTTVRTKNAITIASHYPIRHVQIVLRLYKSVSEILSGFDVDCSCFAYDGSQVYGTPRGIAAFMTQTNTVDLTRRSPSYESRLSKYAHRGFEVYWPDLDRSKIDPTIFERSFARTMGLARLLVLEQLPKPGDREDYLNQRREERGRPAVETYYRSRRSLPDNVKDRDPDDIPEWVYDDEISNYHSFTVPYGPKYHAKKIEKLLYSKDLLLNAEWNQNKDRTVNLHRHPCFMGPLKSVIHDCCGFCPTPKTDEERDVAEKESKIYVFGDLEFMKDDPGRQAIGSFHPLTDDDWTEMAYIGNTQELCQKICDGDSKFVNDWCKKNPDAIDRRDYTGRTPLHLSAQSSTANVLKCLVDNDARIVARLVDGMTALHIAAARGDVDMVTTLLEKSEANEAEEADKEDSKKARRHRSKSVGQSSNEEEEDSDEEMDDGSSEHDTTYTDGSFVKVDEKKTSEADALDDNDEAEPDIYDVNVLAWDTPISPLHLAILGGHVEVIKILISTFGADALLPIKIINQYTRSPQHAIMTLILAARLGDSSSPQVTRDLLAHGASSAQADIHRVSSFHYLVAKEKIELLKACIQEDGAAAKTAINHLVVETQYWNPIVDSPLTTAIRTGNIELVSNLLEAGANPSIDLDTFASAYSASKDQRSYNHRNDDTSKIWREEVLQPIMLAVDNDMPEMVMKLIDAGVDVNTTGKDAQSNPMVWHQDDPDHLHGRSVLDAVLSKIESLTKSIDRKFEIPKPPRLQSDDFYLGESKQGSYAHWYLSKAIESAKIIIDKWEECIAKKYEQEQKRPGKQQSLLAWEDMRARFVSVQQNLKKRGAKTLEEIHPEKSRRKNKEDNKANPSKDVPVGLKVKFRVSASDEIMHGYLQLFEAAWEGNDDKVKELTLASWGPKGDKKPLHVTTQDEKGFTPFAIAMCRRHFDTARLILGIADAQFKEPDHSNTKRRYEIAGGSDDDSEAGISADDDSDDLRLSSQVVDETYTYDNIATLQDSVGSNVLEMLKKTGPVWWFFEKSEKEARELIGAAQIDLGSSLGEGSDPTRVFESMISSNFHHASVGRYAMVSRDIGLFRFWLQCCQDALKMKQKDDNTTTVSDSQDFWFALERGFVEEVAEMIKITGAELPLDALIKKTGIEDTKKPKYYQGLSIGGQKMTGWARERGGGNYRSAVNESTPPLLQAAYRGSLPAVEWFLSDTPLRLYKEHKDKNKSDARLRKLAEAPGGFQAVVGSWLKQRNNLALHAAVARHHEGEKTLEVLKYLIEVMPDSIDVASVQDQLTPLALAFIKGNVQAAEALIKAGADQTARDADGRNLVHMALINASKTSSTKKTKTFKDLVSLIDKRVVGSLFTERSKVGPGGITPLGLLLLPRPGYHYAGNSPRANIPSKIFTIMLEFGGEEATRMMDGSGQFPLHQAVKTSHTAMVKLLLEHDPALLSRENAMGQTPHELAHSLYVRDCAKGNPSIRRQGYKALDSRKPEEFVKKDRNDGSTGEGEDEDQEWNGDIVRTWKICKKYAVEQPKGRKLVSVNEAREVAKRLAERKRKEKEAAEEEGREGEDARKKVKTDEVNPGWLGHGALDLS